MINETPRIDTVSVTGPAMLRVKWKGKGTPVNDGDYMTKSTLMGIMGRMASYTGKKITWEMAMNSEESLGPTTYEFGSLPVPPVAIPGRTKFA